MHGTTPSSNSVHSQPLRQSEADKIVDTEIPLQVNVQIQASIECLNIEPVQLNVQIQSAIDCLKNGNYDEAEMIYFSLLDEANYLSEIGNKAAHDQICYHLIESAIQFQQDPLSDKLAAAVIFGVMDYSVNNCDHLNFEAKLRYFVCLNPNFVIDSTGDYAGCLVEAAITPGRPWTAYELGKLYEDGTIKTYCGPTDRDLDYENSLFNGQDHIAIEKYRADNFFVDSLSHYNAAMAYGIAAYAGNTLAKEALVRLSETTHCPHALIQISTAIDNLGIVGLTKNYGQVLLERADAIILYNQEEAFDVVMQNDSFFIDSISKKNEFISLYFDNKIFHVLIDYSKKLIDILGSDKRMIIVETKNRQTKEVQRTPMTLLRAWMDGHFRKAIQENDALAQFLIANRYHEAIELWNSRDDLAKKMEPVDRRPVSDSDSHMYPKKDGDINKTDHQNQHFKKKPPECVKEVL